MPSVTDLMPWTAPGVKPNRTWVYAPEVETLRERWSALVSAPIEEKSALLKETRDTKVNAEKSLYPGMTAHAGVIAAEAGPCPEPRQMIFRPFDRMWVIPDARVHDTPRPPLWSTASRKQIFVVEQHAHPISAGPALLFSSLIPDMHCHSARGGRVAPLYRDTEGTAPNVTPGLSDFLSRQLGLVVEPEDLMAYLAAVTAHPDFTRRFAAELKTPRSSSPPHSRKEIVDPSGADRPGGALAALLRRALRRSGVWSTRRESKTCRRSAQGEGDHSGY